MNIFTNFKNNSKKIWQTINELQAKTKTKANFSLEINGKVITKQKEVSEEFNKFYTNIAPKLSSTLPECDIDPLTYLRGDYRNSMAIPEINESAMSGNLENVLALLVAIEPKFLLNR